MFFYIKEYLNALAQNSDTENASLKILELMFFVTWSIMYY